MTEHPQKDLERLMSNEEIRTKALELAIQIIGPKSLPNQPEGVENSSSKSPDSPLFYYKALAAQIEYYIRGQK